MYLTYEEYKGMGGTLDETTFSVYEYDACVEVDNHTFNRLKTEDAIPEEVKRCVFKLIDLVKQQSDLLKKQSEGGYLLASQSNDGVSSTYATFKASDFLSISKKEVGETIKKYLNGVFTSDGRLLIYRGLYPNE